MGSNPSKPTHYHGRPLVDPYGRPLGPLGPPNFGPGYAFQNGQFPPGFVPNYGQPPQFILPPQDPPRRRRKSRKTSSRGSRRHSDQRRRAYSCISHLHNPFYHHEIRYVHACAKRSGAAARFYIAHIRSSCANADAPPGACLCSNTVPSPPRKAFYPSYPNPISASTCRR